MATAKRQAPRETLNIRVRPELRGLITVSAYAEFLKRLDAPAKPNDRLRRTMKAPVPWKPT
jgi:uncharacterized protein (DUF1778 family)